MWFRRIFGWLSGNDLSAIGLFGLDRAPVLWEVPPGPKIYERILRGITALERIGRKPDEILMSRAQYEQMRWDLPPWMMRNRLTGKPLMSVGGVPITITDEKPCTPHASP